jgi:hypothetical protein
MPSAAKPGELINRGAAGIHYAVFTNADHIDLAVGRIAIGDMLDIEVE